MSQSVTSYSWKAFHCELCKSEYSDRLQVKGKQYWLFEISKPKSNYLILESVQAQANSHSNNNSLAYQSKTLHVVNLNIKQTIKIGRGHDNDLRVPDISVSRCHAYIKKDSKGRITIEDNNSKFGTLVQVKQPIIINEHITYYLQAGRSIMKMSVGSDWNILGGIMKTNFARKAEEEHLH